MAAISHFKEISKHLNDSICSAFNKPNDSILNLTYEDIDSSYCTLLDDSVLTITGDDNSINPKLRKRSKSLNESICFVGEYIVEPEKKQCKLNKEKTFDDYMKSVVVIPKAKKRKRRNSDCASDDNIEITLKKSKNEFCSTPIRKIRNSDLFTNSEQKRNQIYNSNAFNPYGNDDMENVKRMIILDGSNIAFHHSLGKEFSVKGLEISIKYFEKLGHQVKAVVPQFRLQRFKSTEPNKLEYLNRNGKIVFTPCKNLPGMNSTSYDDRFILQLAMELDGAIISNDNYRDLLYENPGFKKIIQNRVIGYTWCNDIFILPKDPYGKYGPHLDDILHRYC